MSTQPEERSRFANTCPGCGSFHAPGHCDLIASEQQNRDDENAALRAENRELKAKVAALEAMR